MSLATPHLLLIDDERSIREPLCNFLQRNGFRVTQAANAAEARSCLSVYAIDLIVLDIMMPGEDGLSLCRHVCTTSETPVILVTAKTEDADRIAGLEIGADDYVLKPFNPRELVARIRAVLRRTGVGSARTRALDTTTYAFGSWVLNAGQQSLMGADGVTVPLSSGEFNLLLNLVTRPREVLTREQLLDLTQGRAAPALDRSIDNHVTRLRRKIEIDAREPELIKTVWGRGYTLMAEVTRL